MSNKFTRLDFIETKWISNGSVIATKNYKGLTINSELTTAKTIQELNQMATTQESAFDSVGYARYQNKTK